MLTKPNQAGTYLFDIDLYDTDGNKLLESYADYLTLTPLAFSQNTLDLIGNDCAHKGLGELGYTLQTHGLPSGAPQSTAYSSRGEILFSFLGKWDTDLGMGVSSNQEVPCRAILGLSSTIKCVYRVTDNVPQIAVQSFQAILTGDPFKIQIPNLMFNTDGTSSIRA